IAMLLTAALSASLLSGCVTKVSDETAASSAETEAAASDSASAEETTQAESSGETDSESAAGSANLADGSYTIGIGQFAEHGSLDNCREGFLQGLAEEGFVEGENLTVLYQNAQADGANSSQIATNFVGRNVDLI